MLYMDNVQVLNLKDVIRKLPNLRFLTLMNMKYFNCKWLQDVSQDTYLKTNMCQSYSTANESASVQYSTAILSGMKIDDINVGISTQTSYQINNKATRKVVRELLLKSQGKIQCIQSMKK